MSAGARFTVMRLLVNWKPELRMAERTRSLASWTGASGRPTMLKAGMPEAMSTSTSTMAPSRPTTAQLLTLASILEVVAGVGPVRHREQPLGRRQGGRRTRLEEAAL